METPAHGDGELAGGSTCRGLAAGATVGRRRAPRCRPGSGLWRWLYSGFRRPKESARAVYLPETELGIWKCAITCPYLSRSSKFRVKMPCSPDPGPVQLSCSIQACWGCSTWLFYLFSLPYPSLIYPMGHVAWGWVLALLSWG